MAALNFSDWNQDQQGDEAAEMVSKGEMPPRIYLPMHPEARLTAAEKDQLVRGLQATFGGELNHEYDISEHE